MRDRFSVLSDFSPCCYRFHFFFLLASISRSRNFLPLPSFFSSFLSFFDDYCSLGANFLSFLPPSPSKRAPRLKNWGSFLGYRRRRKKEEKKRSFHNHYVLLSLNLNLVPAGRTYQSVSVTSSGASLLRSGAKASQNYVQSGHTAPLPYARSIQMCSPPGRSSRV